MLPRVFGSGYIVTGGDTFAGNVCVVVAMHGGSFHRRRGRRRRGFCEIDNGSRHAGVMFLLMLRAVSTQGRRMLAVCAFEIFLPLVEAEDYWKR